MVFRWLKSIKDLVFANSEEVRHSEANLVSVEEEIEIIHLYCDCKTEKQPYRVVKQDDEWVEVERFSQVNYEEDEPHNEIIRYWVVQILACTCEKRIYRKFWHDGNWYPDSNNEGKMVRKIEEESFHPKLFKRYKRSTQIDLPSSVRSPFEMAITLFDEGYDLPCAIS